MARSIRPRRSLRWGWLLREMLMLLAIVAIAIIAYGKPRPSRLRSGEQHARLDRVVAEAAPDTGDRVRR